MILYITCLAGTLLATDPVLPVGSAPAPLATPHFPDRTHAFIWRNWNVVEPARLARVLNTSVDNVMAAAESMGLPPAVPIPPEQKLRGYITVLRRNWHLLPYDQLLQLLELTPEQLAYALREDDFLWIKLGGLKPRCEPLRYQPPDAAIRQRAAAIKSIVQRQFGDEIRQPFESRFAFVRNLSAPRLAEPPPTHNQRSPAALRYIYSYFALYGDPLLYPELDPYPDGLLDRLADEGINGVWLHVVLRNLAPGGADFPEFGAEHRTRLENLRKLVARAKRRGIGIYLYMNEPRAMPESFFRGRPDMAGVREGDYVALCTSHPAVRKWLTESLAYVFQNVPDLAGVFTITASENLTNCASHATTRLCPRCRVRTDSQILAEVNAAVEAGVHRGNPQAKVIAWDWGWGSDAANTIAGLEKHTWLMSVSEWSLPIERGGVKSAVSEYCLSGVGPGPRALRHWQLAKQAGLKTVAKVQLNNTWELSAVPYLPVMDLVAQHCHNLAMEGVDGMMLSWSLGGFPSPNLEIAAGFHRRPVPAVEDVLEGLAQRRFGPQGAPHARKAWSALSRAFAQYPYDGAVVYQCPVQMGPANLLCPKATGYRATMVGLPYDDLQGWRGIYPAEVFADQFEKVASGWQQGLAELQVAVAQTPPPRRAEVEEELRFAQAARLHFQSVANQARFVLLRDALANVAQPLPQAQRQHAVGQIRRIVADEIHLARQLFSLARIDSRIGFEASNQYYYLPLDLVEKVINCEDVLKDYR
jgi:hypothetical protein